MGTRQKLISILFATVLSLTFLFAQDTSEPIVLGYFPSWSENWTSNNQNSKLREIPSYVNHVFFSFAKPDLTYEKGSFDISGTGIQVPYDGCTLKESIGALNNKGISVILSVGGETYWNSNTIYNNINYQQIKDLVDDIGFSGIDWDFEPNGGFGTIGSPENINHFINFINESRALMPKSEGYIIACAPAGVGALGGTLNNDLNSPFSYENRNSLTGENDDYLYSPETPNNGISLFGFSSTGHMIPVFEAVGDKIDLVALQGYNCGASYNRKIMYESYAYYGNIYNFSIAAGIHFPDEPWGPHYEYTHSSSAELSNYIANYPLRASSNDGIMIWQILMNNSNSSAYEYMNICSMVLNGNSINDALNNSDNFNMEPYSGGAQDCNETSTNYYCGHPEYNPNNTYPTAGTQVYYDYKIWENQWYANSNEIPGTSNTWIYIEDCTTMGINDINTNLFNVNYSHEHIIINLPPTITNTQINLYNSNGQLILKDNTNQESNYFINRTIAKSGIYIITITMKNKVIGRKKIIISP